MYKHGDVVIASPKNNEGKPRLALIVQADWFNNANPPTYIICLFSSDIYVELDFRPIVTPNDSNGLSVISQLMTDKVQVVRTHQISKKIGRIDKNSLLLVDGNLKSLMGL